MSTRNNHGDDDRLKTELRRLKRVGAPWYFESELHQRLHGSRSRRMRLRPFSSASATALSLLTFGVIVFAAYFLVVNIHPIPKGSTEGENASPAHQLPEAAPVAPLQQTEKGPSPPLSRTPHRSSGQISAVRTKDSALTIHRAVSGQATVVERHTPAQSDSIPATADSLTE